MANGKGRGLAEHHSLLTIHHSPSYCFGQIGFATAEASG